MHHDVRFKNLIREFFAEFLRLFFARWAERMDFSEVEWLDKELIRDDTLGDVHALDLVAKVRATSPPESPSEPEPWLVIVHIEIESPDQTTLIKPRLPKYYGLLRARYNLPIVPIVVYLRVQKEGIGIDEYVERVWELEVMQFRYMYVGLPGLEGLEYVQGESWLGVALSSLMRIPRDRVAWLGAEALRRLCEASITDSKRYLLTECVQAYLPMDANQKQEYQALLETPTYQGVRAMNKTVYEEGVEYGVLESHRELVVLLIEQRLGPVSAALREHLESLTSDELKQLMVRAAKAQSFTEAGLDRFVD